MYINDRDALDSFLDAWQQASQPRRPSLRRRPAAKTYRPRSR